MHPFSREGLFPEKDFFECIAEAFFSCIVARKAHFVTKMIFTARVDNFNT